MAAGGAAGPGTADALSFLTEAPDEHAAFPSLVRGTVERARDAQLPAMEVSAESSRRKGLIEEAEMRAEQQALARITMLDLARELEEAARRGREAERQLLKEQREAQALRAALAAAEARLAEALRESEEEEVARVRAKFHASSGSGGFLRSAILWSRIVAPLNCLGAGGLSEEEQGILEVEEGEEEQEDEESEGSQGQLGARGKRSKGDGLTLLWVLRAWADEVAAVKRRQAEEAAEEARRKALRSEMDRMREGYERQLGDERSRSRGLDLRLQATLDEYEQLKRRCDQLEREKAELLKQLKPGEDLSVPLEEMRCRCAELEAMLADRESAVEELKQSVRDLEFSAVQQREEFGEEKRRLKGQIRDLGAELQRQIIFAKHLRDVAAKAKRDAAGSVSPEKFAQLIAELEDMRDKLSVLGSENDREKDQGNLLRMKLEQNRRRLELERQFLPLLHKVRGPVGPKNPTFQKSMAAAATAAMVPDELGAGAMGSPPDRLALAAGDPAATQPNFRPARSRMALSQSMGSLEPLSGHRGGAR